MAVDTNIWDYAAAKVANKGVLARIGHSARFHSVRSAVNSKGSMGSKVLKGLGAIGRASFSLIPIPIIGGLLASAESAIEGKIRSWSHSRHNPGADTGVIADVKFALKEASVENLDRYRFKVEHSVAEMKVEGTKFETLTAAGGDMNCDPSVALAMKIAQAERRIKIFQTEILKLDAIIKASITWAEAASTSIGGYKQQVNTYLLAVASADATAVALAAGAAKDAAVAELKLKHAGCGDFCPFKTNIAGGTWADIRAKAADVVRELSAPFGADNFLSANATSFESADQRENYKTKANRAS